MCCLGHRPLTRPHPCLAQVVQRIKAVEGHTRLLVVDKDTDEELRRRQLTCTEDMAQRGLPPARDPWEPRPDWAHAGSLSSDAGQKVWPPLPAVLPGLCVRLGSLASPSLPLGLPSGRSGARVPSWVGTGLLSPHPDSVFMPFR